MIIKDTSLTFDRAFLQLPHAFVVIDVGALLFFVIWLDFSDLLSVGSEDADGTELVVSGVIF